MVFKKGDKIIIYNTTYGAEHGAACRRPKPLPEAGDGGWVRLVNAAGGRRVCREEQNNLPREIKV